MGCKLVRGETIYFVRHGGERSQDLEPNWFRDLDARLLPPVYALGREGRESELFPSVIPIEIRTFES